MAGDFPFPPLRAGLAAARAFLSPPGLAGALAAMHREMGEAFQIPLPFFNPVFLVGPQTNRFVLVSHKDDFRWRPAGDPVERLLRHGILVEDGAAHGLLRRQISPALHKQRLPEYAAAILQRTDQVLDAWSAGSAVDMLVEMRKITLLVVFDCLFGEDFTPHLPVLWGDVLRSIEYISPGPWILLPPAWRPSYNPARQALDNYLFHLIHQRRRSLMEPGSPPDLLSMLAATPGMSDDLIRDQLITLLIAGHDTATAALAWTLYLLGSHSEALEHSRAEVDEAFGDGGLTWAGLDRLAFMEQVLCEALRLYPPIHVGSRTAAVDLEFSGRRIPAGTRVMVSIYLTHRQEQYWPEPERFDPERFSPAGRKGQAPYTYLPFGGGARNCIGMAFAQLQIRFILARILQRFDLRLLNRPVVPHMGATLEPRPGVWMEVTPRCKSARGEAQHEP